MPPPRGTDGDTGGLLAARTADATTGAPPLLGREDDTDNTEAGRALADGTRARLARHDSTGEPPDHFAHRRQRSVRRFVPVRTCLHSRRSL